MSGFTINLKESIEARAEYFDRRITIQKLSNTTDSQGGKTAPATWAAITGSPKWAHFELWKGNVKFEADQPFAHSYQRCLIRYKKTVNVTAGMRVLYKSQIHTIRWVGVPNQARKVIELMLEELQAEGSVA